MVSPRRALEEWLQLVEAIEVAGGQVMVLDPPAEPLLTGLMYTANAGWLRRASPVPCFRLANPSVSHRKAEASVVGKVLLDLGWEVELSTAIWEGQADMCSLPSGDSEPALILTYGVRSTLASIEEVASGLVSGQTFHAARLRDPFFHGDTCMDPLPAPKGPVWVAFPGAFASKEEFQAARRFASQWAEVFEISESDALGYACNALSIGDELLLPRGLSGRFLDAVVSFGYQARELDLGELFGKGGGGPRCLVNHLRGLAVAPTTLRYDAWRTNISGRLEGYAVSS